MMMRPRCSLTGYYVSVCASHRKPQHISECVTASSMFDTSGVGSAGEPSRQLSARATAVPLCRQGIPAVRAQLEGVAEYLLQCPMVVRCSRSDSPRLLHQYVLPIRLKFGNAPSARSRGPRWRRTWASCSGPTTCAATASRSSRRCARALFCWPVTPSPCNPTGSAGCTHTSIGCSSQPRCGHFGILQTVVPHVQVVAPRSFAEPSDVLELEPILQQVSNWFQRFEAARAPARPSERLPTLQRTVAGHLTTWSGTCILLPLAIAIWMWMRPCESTIMVVRALLSVDGHAARSAHSWRRQQKPAQLAGAGRQQAYPAAAARAGLADAPPTRTADGSPSTGGAPDGSEDDSGYEIGENQPAGGIRSVLSPEEMAELRSLADVADLDLPDMKLQSPPRR
jgi:hypothetical protein